MTETGTQTIMGFSKTIPHIYNTTGTFETDVEVHDLRTCFYDSWYGFATITVMEDSSSNDI
ncbi:MAG TPA: hypothetical protein EYP23_01520 [Thermoplasmata archaeon]|nr:hypothetical protein [Thermoplasmata archaeon]